MVGVTLKSLLAAWVTIVFGTSALIFIFAPVDLKLFNSNPLINFLQSVWELGDAIGPIVKIALILIFGILTGIFKNTLNISALQVYSKSAVIGVISVLLVLLFLPVEYSRGFGIGLTDHRLHPNFLPLYLLGAILGGIAYAYTFLRLSRKGTVSN
ncbi:hypothetical protein [Daejeonella lutea]|uniref:Uncharacterized protein n=1 Tax=Daejeonella lutea TaxID=572036 RepID=A0A1T5DAZ9_9SPHI|nr:hypothetical protein [Daejeonella lutea]SKB68968.1 hypothetical protein SAMN05661099_2270 [Daejeonella lutea]